MRGVRLSNLRAVRKHRGYMIDYVAEMMCVSKYTYMGWESSKPSPCKEDVDKLCKILDVTLEELTYEAGTHKDRREGNRRYSDQR